LPRVKFCKNCRGFTFLFTSLRCSPLFFPISILHHVNEELCHAATQHLTLVSVCFEFSCVFGGVHMSFLSCFVVKFEFFILLPLVSMYRYIVVGLISSPKCVQHCHLYCCSNFHTPRFLLFFCFIIY